MHIRKYIITGAAAAGIVAAGIGSLAFASTSSSTSTSTAPKEVTACVSPRNVVVHLYARATACAKPNHQVAWHASGATGPTGPAGVQTVTVPYTKATVPAGTTAQSVIANCPKGSVAFGGGYSTSGAMTATSSKPTWDNVPGAQPTVTPAGGWQVIFANAGTAAEGVNVWVVCGELDS